MRAIIIGTSLSGKTTLIKHLRNVVNSTISEMDEELTLLNKGSYPLDNNYKYSVLVPQVLKDLATKKDILFFTNTDYFTIEQLAEFRKNGFKIIQLVVGNAELKKRNVNRVKNEGYEDMTVWLKGMLEYQSEIMRKELVDNTINGEQSTEEISNEIRNTLNI